MSESRKESRTQIIATIGPASWEEPVVREMIAHCMDVARINFSWGDSAEHTRIAERVRACAKASGRRIPLIADLSGPRVQKGAGHGFDATCEDILTEKDLRDLDTAAAIEAEYVAMSYVGCGDDVGELLAQLKKRGMQSRTIAKIERAAALEDLAEVIAAADAVMIARGDLGNEIPLETIPFVQREIIRACKSAKKPVITATEMMRSMIDSPRPTRAEVTDVAHAILDGSDAVMLSEETATGKFPVEAVAMMERVVAEAEKHEHEHVHVPL